MAYNQFLVTNAGMTDMLKAQEMGLKLKITKFTLGDSFGYHPSATDVAMHGNKIYEGEPQRERYLTESTKLIVLQVPPEAGPFTFGEVALWTETNTLFALCTFANPIEKFSSLETDVSSMVTFNLILTIDNGVAHITIDYEENPQNVNEIETTDRWALVNSPNSMLFTPITQELVVSESSANGNTTLLVRDYEKDRWNVASEYEYIGVVTPTASTDTSITIDQSLLKSRFLNTTEPKYYLLQFDGNTFRQVTTARLEGSEIKLSWTEPVALKSPETRLYGSRTLSLLFNQLNDVDSNCVHKTGNETIDGTKTFNDTIMGTAWKALWADLAEYYIADNDYKPGTLVCFGGKHEITCAVDTVNAVVSTKPAYVMNTQISDRKNALPIVMCGRVPVAVHGKVQKFDLLYLSTLYPGHASTVPNGRPIARALSSTDKEFDVVECVTRFSL